MTASVTIVIPTYNRAELLRKAIDTSIAQTYPCEIIVVNHGSTDHTDQVADSYGDRIRYIKSETDYGPHFCWLDGIIRATGDYVHLQFDDDWLEPAYIETLIALMQPDVGFAFSTVKVVNTETGQEDYLFKSKRRLPNSGIFPVKNIEKYVLKRLISPAAAIYRKQDLIDAIYQGNLPLKNAHYHGVGPDAFATLLCLLRYPKFGYSQEPLACFRDHANSITTNARSDETKKQQLKAAYQDVKNFYKELKWLQRIRRMQQFFKK
ncbi:glycosyltransferase [Puniceicoccaceae bacterium]|jgi:glycosyltransferase involved in cell wall biosynthesis|nr:glycosyltransferase [Puniceicoccaceae bacterium]